MIIDPMDDDDLELETRELEGESEDDTCEWDLKEPEPLSTCGVLSSGVSLVFEPSSVSFLGPTDRSRRNIRS